MQLNVLDWIAIVLTLIGGVSWGLVGMFDFNVVSIIFGATSLLARAVYILVGISAIYTAVAFLPRVVKK